MNQATRSYYLEVPPAFRPYDERLLSVILRTAINSILSDDRLAYQDIYQLAEDIEMDPAEMEVIVNDALLLMVDTGIYEDSLDKPGYVKGNCDVSSGFMKVRLEWQT